jgi:hypothetical protein
MSPFNTLMSCGSSSIKRDVGSENNLKPRSCYHEGHEGTRRETMKGTTKGSLHSRTTSFEDRFA